jgi:hypothetical protein
MYPFAFAAVAVALCFLAAAVARPRPALVLAAILWAAYAVYEWHVANGTLCDPNCNIRVDLLLLLPLLGLATARAVQKAPRTGAVAVLAFARLALAAVLAALFGQTAAAAIAGAAALGVGAWGVRRAVAGGTQR